MAIRVTDTEKGVRTSNRYRFLRRPCEGWIESMVEYHATIRARYAGVDDWPFWYGERPLTGFLAAGIREAGGVAIEEFSTNKRAHQSDGNDRAYLGRGDPYYCIGKHDANIEFKLDDLGIGATHEGSSFIARKKWEATLGDARDGHTPGIPSLGGLFLRTYIGKGRDPDFYRLNLASALESAWNALQPDALAWWCPIDRALRSDKSTKNLIVGVVLLMKHAKGRKPAA